MQYKNHIEICGRVGAAEVREVNGVKYARFSVVVVDTYGQNGGICVSDTWFSCVWIGIGDEDAEALQKGAVADVSGRMRAVRYANAEGQQQQTWEVVVKAGRVERPDGGR